MLRFLGRLLLLALFAGAVAALAFAVRRTKTAPPSLDHWPAVPRNPAAAAAG